MKLDNSIHVIQMRKIKNACSDNISSHVHERTCEYLIKVSAVELIFHTCIAGYPHVRPIKRVCDRILKTLRLIASYISTHTYIHTYNAKQKSGHLRANVKFNKPLLCLKEDN